MAYNDLVFNVVFAVDEVTFGINMLAENQNIEVGFDHFQVITQKLEDFYEYKGSYTVTPSTEVQILATKDRRMSEDVMISAIPYVEIENTAGGKTVMIG